MDTKKGYEKFANKVWLSSPTMHGLELKYMMEAYESNWMSTVGANINEVERLTCEKIGVFCSSFCRNSGITYGGEACRSQIRG